MAGLREVSASLRRRRDDQVRSALTFSLVQALIGEEEERPIVPNRTACRASILIALQLALLQRKELLRIERIVTHELVHAGSELVGAGLGHGVDDRAHVPSVLRAEVARLNREFFQRVGIRHDRGDTAQHVVVVAAVQHVVVGDAAKAMHRDPALLLHRREAVACDDARQQHLQQQRISPVERKLADPPLVDDLAQRATDRFDVGG